MRYPDGAGCLVSGGTYATKGEAQAELARVRTNQVRGNWVNPRAGATTLSSYSTTWLAEQTLRPRSRELYEWLLRSYIVPHLGPIQLAKLTPAAVRVWHSELRGTGKASTAAKAYRVLRAILNTAVADEMIVKNPCVLKGAGVESAPERPIASTGEVAALADSIDPRFRLLVLLAAWCGLRRGELLALRRRDIDLLRGAVRIERARTDHGGPISYGLPKTEAGKRTVALPPHLLPEVEHHLLRFVEGDSDALVFTGLRKGPLRVHVLQKAWDKARRQIGRPDLHLHDMRHTGNTLAAAAGASTKELMSRMGHSSSRAALIYQHATEDRDRAIAEALSRFVEPAPVVPMRGDGSAPSTPNRESLGHAGGTTTQK